LDVWPEGYGVVEDLVHYLWRQFRFLQKTQVKPLKDWTCRGNRDLRG
jgi:hypothetical protein